MLDGDDAGRDGENRVPHNHYQGGECFPDFFNDYLCYVKKCILLALKTNVFLKYRSSFILMKIFPFKHRQNDARLILIIGLLAGLFFSGGEGVQLFPFPIAEGDSSKNTASLLEKNLKSYVFSVHNSGNHLPTLQSKFQKHTNQYLHVGRLPFGWSNFQANFYLTAARHREETDFSNIFIVSGSLSDRAPPIA